MGKLLAQMIDGLHKSITSTRNDQTGGVRVIKGMLSSGQHSLFFLLREAAPKPELVFIGRFAVKVFDKVSDRRSWLDKNKTVSREEVAAYFKNLFYFLVETR
jgi:hypothetical protein